MPDLKKYILLAIIGKPHGLKGEVRVKLFTEDPQAIKAYNYLTDANLKRFEIETIRPGKGIAFVKFKGIESRSDAEALVPANTKLYVDRQQLADDLGEDEFYQADLVGLKVLNDQRQQIGCLSGVFNFGAGEILEVKLDAGSVTLIPFTKLAVPDVKLEDGYIVVDPVAAGLTDIDNLVNDVLIEDIKS